MSLLDMFTIRVKIDSEKADSDLDRIVRKAKKGSKEIEDAAGAGADGLNDAGDAADKSLTKGAKIAALFRRNLVHVEDALGKVTDKAKGMGGSLGFLGNFVKGPGLLMGGVVAMATVAAAVTARAKSQADEATARLDSIRKDAWDAGMRPDQFLQKTSFGEQLGINPEDMKQSLTSINEMAKGVLLHRAGPLGGIDMTTGQDTDPMSRLLRKHKINLGSPGAMRSANDIYDTLVEEIKRVADTKGRAAGVALGQKFGFAFDAVQKIVDTPMEGLYKAAAASREYAAQQTLLSRMTIQYNKTQKELELSQKKVQTTADLMVVPSVNRFNKAMLELTKASQPLVTWLAKVTAGIVDMTTGLIQAGTKILNLDWNEQMAEGQADYQKVQEASLVGLKQQLTDLEAKQKESKAGQQGTSYGYRPAMDYSAEIEAVKQRIKETESRMDAAKKQIEFGKGADVGPKPIDMEAWSRIQTWAREAYKEQLTAEQIDSVLKENMGASDDAITQKLEALVNVADKGLAANQAQLDVQREMLPQIVQNTAVGLEQALAMWAGGIGRAANIGGAAFSGQGRADFESRAATIRFTPDPQMMRAGAAAVERARESAGAAGSPGYASSAMSLANSAANSGQRLNEQSRLGATSEPKKSGDLNLNGDIIVQPQTATPQDIGTHIGRGVSDMMGSMRKEIANMFDSSFKA